MAVGATVVALTAVAMLVVLPFARRWSEREAVIFTTGERLARLSGIAGQETAIRAQLVTLDAALDGRGARLVRARTPALASSIIQSYVQAEARASRVSISRLDVAGSPATPGGDGVVMPATLSAVGDIYGVADYLRRLQHGPRLIEIAELAVAPNPTLRGNLLQLSLTLRIPVALEP